MLWDALEGGLPGGRDRYLREHVLEGCDEEAATALLRDCREAIRADRVLTITERMLPDPVGEAWESVTRLFSDQRTPSGPGGKSRTEAEFSELLDPAGPHPASVENHQADHSVNVVTARVC